MFNQHRLQRVLELISVLKTNPPKSSRYLAQFMEVSGRSIYRYFKMLQSLGFKVTKGPNFTYYIPEDENGQKAAYRFTTEEVALFEKYFVGVEGNNPLVQSMMHKIKGNSEVAGYARDIRKAHLSKIMDDLSFAMSYKRQVVLKQYYSASSQTVCDRLVEPVAFTDNYVSICAFEVASKQNKYFNVERISRLEVLETPMAYTKRHAFFEPDIFGFQGSTLDKEIEMMLSMRAYLILIHEYPKSRNFIKEIPEMQSYHLKARVQDFLAPGRFVAGLRDHITVLGSEGFVDFIASNSQVPIFKAKKRKPAEIRGLLPGKKKIFTGIK